MNNLENNLYLGVGELILIFTRKVKNPYLLGWFQIFKRYANGEVKHV